MGQYFGEKKSQCSCGAKRAQWKASSIDANKRITFKLKGKGKTACVILVQVEFQFWDYFVSFCAIISYQRMVWVIEHSPMRMTIAVRQNMQYGIIAYCVQCEHLLHQIWWHCNCQAFLGQFIPCCFRPSPTSLLPTALICVFSASNSFYCIQLRAREEEREKVSDVNGMIT